MERYNRVVDLPEIEAKKIFSQVVDYEISLLRLDEETEKEYLHKILNEYVKLFLERARIIERRSKK